MWTVDDPIYSTWNPIVTWDSGIFPNNNNNKSSVIFYKNVWPAVIFVMCAFQMKTLCIAIKTEFRVCEIKLRFSWFSSFSPDKCQDNIVADTYYGNKSPKITISLVETVCNLYEI
jgi:hypothetical protein